MKIIFDSKEEKEQVIKQISRDHCPGHFRWIVGMEEHYMSNDSDDCLAGLCRKCWRDALSKLEVKNDERTNN